VVTRLAALGRAATSPLALASLATPLAGVAALSSIGWLDLARAVESAPVRAWAVAALVALLGCLVRAMRERRLAAALGLAAVTSVALQLLATWAWRLDGTLDAGEGEEAPPWRTLVAGPSARPPEVRLLALPGSPAGETRLKVGETEVSVPVAGDAEVAGGLTVTVSEPLPAPSFEVRRASGREEAAGLLKLHPGERTWFEAGLLPHRFYATLAGGGDGAPRVKLTVHRGKLKLVERELPLGERAEVEGLSVTFGAGARWARIRVRRAAPWWPAAAALALGAAAGAAWWRQRRGRA
jgi:hypothetical protein